MKIFSHAPYRLELWQQRLTVEELRLIRRFHHELSAEEKERKRLIMVHEMALDCHWGFFDHGFWSWVRRTYYKLFVHRRYQLQPEFVPFDHVAIEESEYHHGFES